MFVSMTGALATPLPWGSLKLSFMVKVDWFIVLCLCIIGSMSLFFYYFWGNEIQWKREIRKICTALFKKSSALRELDEKLFNEMTYREGNALYRICLAKHGMKTENLIK